MKISALSLVAALCAGYVHSQTLTTTDDDGQTVVEFITIDPDLGLPTTQTLETITTPTTTTTTTAAAGQGPVGQPQTQQGAADPTVYTYTTTDAAGNTQAVVDTFTASFATGAGTFTASPGTILNYSSWRAGVGSNTVAVVSSGITRWTIDPRWVGIGVAVCAGMTSGAWLAFA